MSTWVTTLTVYGRSQVWRFANGTGVITLGGEEYVGGGRVINIEAVGEPGEFVPRTFRISLNGVEAGLLGAALQDPVQGNRARMEVWRVNVTGAGVEEAAHHVQYEGVISHAEIIHDHGAGTGTLSYVLTTETANHDNRPQAIYSNESQKLRDPEDTAFDRLPQLVDQELIWGANSIRGYR